MDRRFALALALALGLGLGLGACDAASTPTLTLTPDAGPSGLPAPAAPVFAPCPTGWREVSAAAGLVTCEPWPETGHSETCAYGEAHFPGTPGCVRLGAACAADGWPTGLPTDQTIVFVDDDAAPGGDGATQATALRSLAEASARAPRGSIVAIAAGRYDTGDGATFDGVTLWGACVSGTRLTSSHVSDLDAVVGLQGGGARNLSVDGAERVGLLVTAGIVVIEDVIIDQARSAGLQLWSGSSTVTRVVVRGTRTASLDRWGFGAEIDPGASGVLAQVIFDGNHQAGIVIGGANLVLTDAAILGTLPASMATETGEGMYAFMGSTLSLARVTLERNSDLGISIGDGGSQLDAEDVVIRDTLTRGDGLHGRGVNVGDAATVSLRRVRIEQNHETGLFVENDGTNVMAQDLLIRDTLAAVAGPGVGRGIVVHDGSVLALTRVRIERSFDTGLFLDGRGADVTATDIAILDTRPRTSDLQSGSGVWAQGGAHVSLTNARVEASHMSAISAVHAAAITLENVTVSGVEPAGCVTDACSMLNAGFGLSAHFGASLAATHFLVEDASLCGVSVGADDPTEPAPTSLDLAHGAITRAAIGACVQNDGFDSTRLQNDVQYRDVGAPLRATSYELPDSL